MLHHPLQLPPTPLELLLLNVLARWISHLANTFAKGASGYLIAFALPALNLYLSIHVIHTAWTVFNSTDLGATLGPGANPYVLTIILHLVVYWTLQPAFQDKHRRIPHNNDLLTNLTAAARAPRAATNPATRSRADAIRPVLPLSQEFPRQP